jgi:protein O-mannosyl-transferase
VSVFAVYWRVLDAPFVFDDVPAIVDNPSTERLWPPIGDVAAPGPLNPPGLAPTSRRPLVNLTFALDRHLYGLRPRGYRVVNLLAHVLTAAVLASIVRRTLRLPHFAGTTRAAAWPLSLAVALVWALHPLNTEAVAYVTQRTEIFGALFYLTTLWAALRYWAAASPAARGGWVAVAALACLAGTASKEIVVSAPLVVLLYERTFLAGSLGEVRRSWRLYAGLVLGWVLLLGLNAGGIPGLADARHNVPLHVWWMTQAKVLFLYLKLAVWPWPLSIHYAPRYLRTLDAAWPWLAAASALAAATLALAWRRPAVRPVVGAIVLVLAPTLVVPLPKMMAAERRMYLPLAGIVALTIVAGRRLATTPTRVRVAAAAVAAAVLTAGVTSVARLAAYESAVTIWHDAVLHQPDDAMARYNLGVALLDEGRTEDARARFTETLGLDPEHPGALDNLGMVLTRLGRPEEAVAHLERALAIDPDDAIAHNNLGMALIALGRPGDAVPHLERALRVGAGESKAPVHLNLGRALLDGGRDTDAIAHLERAVELAPGDADAHFSLGVALTRTGRAKDARGPFERALRLKPDDAEARSALATALLQSGETAAAAEEYRHALRLRPDYAEAHSNLGAALLALGSVAQAIEHLRRAVGLSPGYANAHYNLGSALLQDGRPREAVVALEAAVRLRPDDARARLDCAVAYARGGDAAAAQRMASAALTLARAQGDDALAGRIETWLASDEARPAR